jgi:hypothetical protein
MAETTNYDLPIPNHLGIQQAEIQRIADAMTLIDTLLKQVNDSLATKLAAAGYTAADVLAKLKTVDGAGSGLDADLLDGQSSVYYLNLANSNGIIPEGNLPDRLRGLSTTITDCNDAVLNGWYNGSAIANAPDTSWWLIHVERHFNAATVWCTQTAHSFTSDSSADTKLYRRECNNGTWGDWYRLRWSEAELDNRYLQSSAYTAASILAKLLTVDGTSSGLDADKLRGLLPDAAATASTIAQRDGSGDLTARLFRSAWATLNASPNYVITQNAAGAGDNYYRPTSLAQFKTALSITVADVANAVPNSRQFTAGNGLTGGGNLAADRAFAVGAGTGISVTATAVNVDATVWRDGNLPTTAQINGIIGYTPANIGWTLTAGAGLTGGGTLAANRSIAVDATVWRDGNQPTGAQVLALANSVGAGGVGTYALCKNTSAANLAIGDTIAGSNLAFYSFLGNAGNLGGTPSGTWECCGDGKSSYVSVYRRIA